MQRRIITTTLAAIICCMTAGWHVWPLALGIGAVIGLRIAGYKMADDRPMYISDDELYKWLEHG